MNRKTGIIIIFLVLLNLTLVYKVYNQKNELAHVYEYSDFLKRKSSKIVFDTYIYDFGTVKLNKDYTSIFSFTNVGNKKIKLLNVLPTCGCTVLAWNKDPILPGTKGSIQLKYHAGPVGDFNKKVGVLVEGEIKPIQLEIKGKVIAK